MNLLKWRCPLFLLSWFVFLPADPGTSLAGINEDLIQAIRHVKAEGVEDLLARGADPNACDREGWNPFLVAASTGQNEIVKLLLEKGADINGKCATDMTALMIAADRGKTETVQFLLEKGADVKARDLSGSTAYDIALSRRRPEVVKLLTHQPVSPEIILSQDFGVYLVCISS